MPFWAVGPTLPEARVGKKAPLGLILAPAHAPAADSAWRKEQVLWSSALQCLSPPPEHQQVSNAPSLRTD